ncbi:unnamed protein product [Vitrella brassicaformis CCMP3155]|uniref:Uncharacterized protein n=1 Tax=Vitrella brassicaformis (strain CCMP3155) TaxID=1169540 RepID=A0A0G4E9B6_VITBC|nr:unnamed protein product [Vitrella brassicaformis CCMP3155]|eukprot:CEL91958.1 unnamed protein product [Vitrella brassicaformis CCMP3155]
MLFLDSDLRTAMARSHETFEGRVVWITGASSGIGRAMATQLAKAGARLIISGRNVSALNELRSHLLTLQPRGAAQEVILTGKTIDEAANANPTHDLSPSSYQSTADTDSKPPSPYARNGRVSTESFSSVASADRPTERVVVLPFDLSSLDTLPEFSTRAFDTFGRIDMVCLNAGVSQRSLAEQLPFSSVRHMMSVDCLSPICIVKTLLPRLQQQGGARILISNTLQAKIALPGRSSYGASKAALRSWFDSLRAELEGQRLADGITDKASQLHVTQCLLGYVNTSLSLNAIGAGGQRHAAHDPTTSKGMSADRAAQLMLRAAGAHVEEAWIGKRKELLHLNLCHYAPDLFAWGLRRQNRKRVLELRGHKRD